MLKIIKRVDALFMLPAKIINVTSGLIGEESIISRLLIAVIAIFVGITNLREGCFYGDEAMVNLLVFFILLFLLKMILCRVERFFFLIIEKITWMPSRLFDLCIK